MGRADPVVGPGCPSVRIALPISGGLDSTYLLWKLLEKGEDDITVVFLDLRQYTGQHPFYPNISLAAGKEQDLFRVQRICDRLSLTPRIIDSFSGVSEKSSLSRYLVDKFLPEINAGQLDALALPYEYGNEGHSSRMAGRTEHGYLAAMRTFKERATRGKLWLPLMEDRYCQAHAFEQLPTDLLSLTLSCERPVDDAPCGVCFKCAKRKFFLGRLEAGFRPNQAFDAWYRQATVEPGKWWPTRNWLRLYVPEYERPVLFEKWDFPTWPSSVDCGL